MKTDIYRDLQKHLDNMPVPFPESEKELDIHMLQYLFTPLQARIGLCLSLFPEPVPLIYKRVLKSGLSLTLEEVEEQLVEMDKKGAVLSRELKGAICYSKAMFVVGMYEFQVNNMTPEFDALSRAYGEDVFFQEKINSSAQFQVRTIPIEQSLHPERRVGTYDDARQIIAAESGPFAVANCVCKQGKDASLDACKVTSRRDTCLMIGEVARDYIKKHSAREVTREKLLETLALAEKEGLVIQPENSQKPTFICCCCGCCCLPLTSIKKMEKPADVTHSNYRIALDQKVCNGCGVCVKRCPMDALTLEDKKAAVNRDRCIGCGVCAAGCKKEALALEVKEETHVPPKDTMQLYTSMMKERFGIFKLIWFLIKNMFKLKV